MLVSTREKKEAMIAELQEHLGTSGLTIVADYRGLSVADLQTLRRELRTSDAQLKVAKNTLLRLAAQRAAKEAILPLVEGPIALVFSDGDVVAAAKTVTRFATSSRILQVRGALMQDRLLTAEEVSALAALPAREELLGKLLGSLQAPVNRLVWVLSGVARSLVYVLQARADQLKPAENA